MLRTINLCLIILLICVDQNTVKATDAEDAKFEKLFCNADKTDSAKVIMINECEDKYRSTMTAEAKALAIKIDQAFHKNCLEKTGDMSKFTKVDLTKAELKNRLIDECDKRYFKCMTKLINGDDKLNDDVNKAYKLEDRNEKDKFDNCTMEAAMK